MTGEEAQLARDAQDVLKQALDHEAVDRAAFLDRACAGRPELRGEVESLLEAHDRAGVFLETPALALANHAADTADLLLGQHVGRYRVESVIASGGMGTVYRAVQDDPHRTVALKILRPGVTSRTALRRFRHESHVLGRLQHPNIAQVYEAGTLGGVPFFAMEHVADAQPITEYARSH
ncbi:MAG: protein kinase domain-containing protein, partial [Planctomycetota bacterium]